MAKMRLTLEADGPGFRLLSEQSNRNRWAATLLHVFMAETKDDFVDSDLPCWDDLGLKNVSITVAAIKVTSTAMTHNATGPVSSTNPKYFDSLARGRLPFGLLNRLFQAVPLLPEAHS